MINGTLPIEWAIVNVPGVGVPITGTVQWEWAILDFDPTTGTIDGELDLAWRVWGTDTLDFILNGAPTGMIGALTISITLNDGLGTVLYAPTTQGIVESPPSSGRYVATVPNPGAGSYFIVWSDGISTTTVALLIELVQAAFVKLFRNRTPPARIDAVAWTSVDIMEGATRRGPYVSVETIALDPVDADPSDPATRDIQTTDAVLTAGWYGLAWTDDAGQQAMTDPEFVTSVIAIT